MILNPTADQIEAWVNSHRKEAELLLPELIQRLILASPVQCHQIEFLSGNKDNLPGYDGVVEAGSYFARLPLPFVPEGLSVWELSVRKDVAYKAQSDYNARTLEPGKIIPNEATFVVVNLRAWNGRGDWCAERRAERRWKHVEAWDGEQIAIWMNALPAVAAWFAYRIGLRFEGALSLDDHLRHWRGRLPGRSIPPSVLLAGRDGEAARVRQWALDPRPAVLPISAPTPEEALTFACAALDDPRPLNRCRQQLHANTVIVQNEQALEWLLKHPASTSMILLPAFEYTRLGEDRARILAPLTVPDACALTLHPMTPWALGRALHEQAGYTDAEARQIAEASNGTLAGLLRAAGAPERPAWFDPTCAAVLLPALLAGAWEHDRAEDRAILGGLAERSYDDYTTHLLRPLTCLPDPPLIEHPPDTWNRSARWDWPSRRQVWALLRPFVTGEWLERWGAQIDAALAHTDPSLHLTHEETMERLRRGDWPAGCSDALKQGLVEGLELLAQHPVNTRAPHTAADFIALRVRRALHRQPAGRWEALACTLPTLARLAPDAFIKALRASLDAPDCELRLLLQPRGYHQATHALDDLCCALKGIARQQPEQLREVLTSLARLAVFEPEPRNATWRPVWSALLDLLMEPCVLLQVPVEQHGALLGALGEVERRARLDLLYGHTRMERAPDGISTEDRGRLLDARFALLRGCATSLLASTVQEPKLWDDLLEPWRGDTILRLGLLEPLVDHLQRTADALGACEQREALAWALRRFLHHLREQRHRRRVDLFSQAHVRLLPLYLQIEPGVDGQAAWWFTSGITLEPDGPDEETLEERMHLPRQRRQEALEAILSAPDAIPRLLRLAARIGGGEPLQRDSLWGLGETLGAVARPEQEEALLGAAWEEPGGGLVLRGLYAARIGARRREDDAAAWAWLGAELARAARGELDARREVALIQATPLLPPLLDALEGLPPAWVERFWQQLGTASICTLSPAEATPLARALINRGRGWEAFVLLSACMDRPGRRDTKGAAAWPAPLLHDALEAVCARALERHDAPLQEVGRGYDVALLHAALRAHPERARERLILQEAALHPLLERYHARLEIHQALNEDPALFLELLGYAEHLEDDAPSPNEAAALRRQRLAPRALGLLYGWEGTPGLREDGVYDAALAARWVCEVRAGLAGRERVRLGLWRIGDALAHAPAGKDGRWPREDLCAVLEELAPLEEDLVRGVACEQANALHPGMRTMHVGGDAEREAVARYDRWAEELRWTWPTAAELLRAVSRELRRRADSYDGEVEDLRHRRMFDLTATQEGHFTMAQARAAGFDLAVARLLEGGIIEQVIPGVYRLTALPPAEDDQLVALWLWSQQEGVFSHDTALSLHGLSDVNPALIHMTLPARWGTRRLRTPAGVELHFSGDGVPHTEFGWHGSVPCTTPARTVCDCAAAQLAPELMRQAIDQGLRAGRFKREEIDAALVYLRSFEQKAG